MNLQKTSKINLESFIEFSDIFVLFAIVTTVLLILCSYLAHGTSSSHRTSNLFNFIYAIAILLINTKSISLIFNRQDSILNIEIIGSFTLSLFSILIAYSIYHTKKKTILKYSNVLASIALVMGLAINHLSLSRILIIFPLCLILQIFILFILCKNIIKKFNEKIRIIDIRFTRMLNIIKGKLFIIPEGPMEDIYAEYEKRLALMTSNLHNELKGFKVASFLSSNLSNRSGLEKSVKNVLESICVIYDRIIQKINLLSEKHKSFAENSKITEIKEFYVKLKNLTDNYQAKKSLDDEIDQILEFQSKCVQFISIYNELEEMAKELD